jgi:type IV pilus assembly protein PilV
MDASRRRGRGERGFTLIEALVALLVLSIGLLGLASLQLASLRSSHGAALRSQATMLSYDITDRMRANRIDANRGDYVIAIDQVPTAGTVAGNDLVAWRQALARTLPEGKGSIVARGAGAGRVFTIRVEWQERDTTVTPEPGSEPPTLSFETETQL